jgi:hypothetical protein
VGAGDGEGSLPLPQLDRKIIRTARLELDVENVSAAVTEVEDVAEAAGGWVSASSVFVDGASDDESPRRTETAMVTIRVPADAYRSVVSQLRSLAEEVRSETSEASYALLDRTREYCVTPIASSPRGSVPRFWARKRSSSSRPGGQLQPAGSEGRSGVAVGQFHGVWDRSVSRTDGLSCAFEDGGGAQTTNKRTNRSVNRSARTSGESRRMIGRAILPSALGQ